MNKYKKLIEEELMFFHDTMPFLAKTLLEQYEAVVNAGFVEKAEPRYVADLIIRMSERDVL